MALAQTGKLRFQRSVEKKDGRRQCITDDLQLCENWCCYDTVHCYWGVNFAWTGSSYMAFWLWELSVPTSSPMIQNVDSFRAYIRHLSPLSWVLLEGSWKCLDFLKNRAQRWGTKVSWMKDLCFRRSHSSPLGKECSNVGYFRCELYWDFLLTWKCYGAGRSRRNCLLCARKTKRSERRGGHAQSWCIWKKAGYLPVWYLKCSTNLFYCPDNDSVRWFFCYI